MKVEKISLGRYRQHMLFELAQDPVPGRDSPAAVRSATSDPKSSIRNACLISKRVVSHILELVLDERGILEISRLRDP